MQKTAFEVRISDWSSDVCSSYLTVGTRVKASYSDANFEVDDAPVDGQNRSGRLSLERTSFFGNADVLRSEEHTSELQSLMRSSYAVFCLKKKRHNTHTATDNPRKAEHRRTCLKDQ